jgi:DNA-directed RNA polymerase specialized sigma24 family protein
MKKEDDGEQDVESNIAGENCLGEDGEAKIDEATARNREILRELTERPEIIALIRRRSGKIGGQFCQHDYEDANQEAWSRAWQNAGAIRKAHSTQAVLAYVATTRKNNFYNRKTREGLARERLSLIGRQESSGKRHNGSLLEQTNGSDPETRLIVRDRLDRILEAARNASRNHPEVLDAWIAGIPARKIARPGLSIATVYRVLKQIGRAIKKADAEN